jgi:hypothetical protein
MFGYITNFQYTNYTLAPATTTTATITIINNWKHYLRLLNILIIISFLCDCILLIYLILNSIHRHCCFLIKNKKNKISNNTKHFIINYVTLAFISHQAFIDLLRIIYCLLYLNNLNFHDPNNRENYLITFLTDNIYTKYCFQIATFYSILTMVTLVNTLAIFISETCRFYDLKLNSNDTSNVCCVLFGVMLIWLSSLIIISSIMLIGIADSAAPNQCNEYIMQSSPQYTQSQYQLEQYHKLIATTTTTRTFVINFVWLFIVFVIIGVVIFYTKSLYKELHSLDYKHHRISIYALYQPKQKLQTNAGFQRRHFIIVKQTSKRLLILFALVLIFCVTWFPNFLLIILSSFLKNSNLIRGVSLFCSVFWLFNPCFNAYVFIYFLIKERKNEKIYYDDDVDEYNFCDLFSRLLDSFKMKKEAKILKRTSLSFIEMQSDVASGSQSMNNHVDFEALQTKVGNRLRECNHESDSFI